MSGNFIIVAHLLGVIGSLRLQKCAQIIHCIPAHWMDLGGRFHSGGRWVYWEQETDGETAAENNTVHVTTSMQLLFPVVLSAFQQDVDLTLRSVLGAGFSRSSFLRITFCKDVALSLFFFLFFLSQYSHRANRMPCQSASRSQSPVLRFVIEVYFCHKRNKTKTELMPAA